MYRELRKILESLEFEENGFIQIKGYESVNDFLLVKLSINTGDKGQFWQIKCENPIDYVFNSNISYDLNILDEHILLWPYQQNKFELFFNGKSTNAGKIITELYEKHREITNSWFSFDKFFNPELTLSQLINGSHGKLAEGPDIIINEYEKVLKQNGLGTSKIGPKSPKYWDGKYWQDVMDLYKVLIIDTSYLIAKAFEVNKM